METAIHWKGVDLEDSWILSWYHDSEHAQLVFKIDASLWPGHPAYEEPLPGEHTCYKPARLIFDAVVEVNGLPPVDEVNPMIGPDGSVDYGNIEGLRTSESGTYAFTIELRDISVGAGKISLEVDSNTCSAT